MAASTDGDEPQAAGAKVAAKGQAKPERFATILLLLVATGALTAVLWSSRSDQHSASHGSRVKAKRARAIRPAASQVLSSGATATPRPIDAVSLLTWACPGVSPPSCECRFKALGRSFSLADGPLSHAVLQGVASDSLCAASAPFLGYKAEVLARLQSSETEAAVLDARAKDPNDAHAALAAAYRKLMNGDIAATRELLEQATRFGRGAAADTLKGVLALRENNTSAAKAAFERALSTDPEDVDALYNLGALEMAQGVYNKPRSRFLKLLSLRPDHVDARFALASLTYRAGALPEAQRHQARLEADAPTGDERVLKLRELMQSAPAQNSTQPSSAPIELHVKSSK